MKTNYISKERFSPIRTSWQRCCYNNEYSIGLYIFISPLPSMFDFILTCFLFSQPWEHCRNVTQITTACSLEKQIDREAPFQTYRSTCTSKSQNSCQIVSGFIHDDKHIMSLIKMTPFACAFDYTSDHAFNSSITVEYKIILLTIIIKKCRFFYK